MPPHFCQIKMLDSENTKKSKEVAELQARVAVDEQREEETRRESFGLKQKIVESEASRESAKKEVSVLCTLPLLCHQPR